MDAGISRRAFEKMNIRNDIHGRSIDGDRSAVNIGVPTSPAFHRRTAASSSIAWAFRAARWISGERLRTAGQSACDSAPPAVQLARACDELGLNRARALALPDAACLPLVCRTDGRGWGVVVGRTPAGRWITRYASGEAHVTALALHNACYAAPTKPDAARVVVAPPPRAVLLSGLACMPLSGGAWQGAGNALALLTALLLGVQLIRWLGRRLKRRRRPLLSSWAEEFRLARQRERILRQSIRSNVPFAAGPSRPAGQDAMHST